jgi:hypothetical protein
VLRDNGVVFVTVPAYQFLWSAHDDLNNHRRRYVARQLRGVVESAGFRVEVLAYFNSLLFPAAVARRLGGRLLGSRISREFEPVTPWLNEVMRRVFVAERGIVRRAGTSRFAFRFPFGLSILCVGRRV